MKMISNLTKSKNSFSGQKEGEEVALLLRQHPLVIIFQTLFFIFLAIIPIIIGVAYYPTLQDMGLLVPFLFLTSLVYLILWSVIFYYITIYTLHVWIVTNKRIMDSTQKGFFSRTVSELYLNRIQDTSVEIHGFIKTIFKYGDLEIQTAGTEVKFKFKDIGRPKEVKGKVMELVAEYKRHNH